MPKPTKVVVHFDDGTTTDIPADGVGSIFFSEAKAVKCGHKPPYKKPPKPPAGGTTSTMAFAAAADESGTGEGGGEASAQESNCYWVNGMIVCP
jgi:hypothetical protein